MSSRVALLYIAPGRFISSAPALRFPSPKAARKSLCLASPSKSQRERIPRTLSVAVSRAKHGPLIQVRALFHLTMVAIHWLMSSSSRISWIKAPKMSGPASDVSIDGGISCISTAVTHDNPHSIPESRAGSLYQFSCKVHTRPRMRLARSGYPSDLFLE